MNLKINGWYGRLGNNIIQLKNAIQIAIYYNYNIILPYHKYFTTTYIIINDKVNIDDTIFIDDNFYYAINNIDKNLFNENIDKTISILKEYFSIKNIPSLNKNDLIIHIRSGDIFYTIPTHNAYIVPPLSYYVNIINNNNFDNITIIAEDNINPCINKLLELYPKIKFNKQSLDDDIKLILATTNIIESFGSFTTSLLLLSDNIINIYRTSYQSSHFNIILSKSLLKNINKIDLPDYYKKMFPWENTDEQKTLMLSY